MDLTNQTMFYACSNRMIVERRTTGGGHDNERVVSFSTISGSQSPLL